MKILVMLVDDHRIVRDGLRAILEKEERIDVVAEANNGRDAVRLAGEFHPDIVIMDIAMPGINGMEATRRIVAEHPGTQILILSMHNDKSFVVEAFNAGARGYVLKECAAREIVRAIDAIQLGEAYLSPKITSIVVKDLMKQHLEETPTELSTLSSREREVLQLVAEGKNTKEIAYVLGVNNKTIEAFRKKLMTKLNLNSIAELTKFAIRHGLTSID